MLKIKLVSVGDNCCKVELTSEDGAEVVSVLHACCVRGARGRDEADWWVEAPNIEFSENLRRRIMDALYYKAGYRSQWEEDHAR